MRSGPVQALSLLLLWASHLAGATRGPSSLSGQVYDVLTALPVPEAIVSLEPEGVQVVTDGEGRFSFDGLTDTVTGLLRVTHPDFLPTEVPLGATAGLSWALGVGMHPRIAFTPGSEEQRQARVMAEATAAQTGGTLWRAEEFAPYSERVTHVLDLLVYSGLVEDFERLDSGRRCLRIRRDLECASVRVGGTSTISGAQSYAVAGIDSILILPPELSGAGSPYEGESGVVVLFLRPVDSP